MSFDVSAVTATKFLTAQETLALFGNSITAQVYDNGSYRNISFTYLGEHSTNSAGISALVQQGENSFSSWPALEYRCSDTGSISLTPDAVTVYLNPEYSIFDTTSFASFVALSTNSDVSSAVYTDSAWDLRMSGSASNSSFYSIAYNGKYNYSGAFNEFYYGDNNVVMIPCDIQQQSTFSISSVECRFRGCSSRYDGYGNEMYLYIGCPRIDDDSTFSSGTVSTGTSGSGGSGDVNVNVDIDMEETNGLLENIWEGITGLGADIWGGITHVFVPSQEDIEDFKESVEETIADTFAPVFTAASLTDDAFNAFQNAVADGDMELPALVVPSLVQETSSGTFLIPGSGAQIWAAQQVKLRPESAKFAQLYEVLATVIDIVCTIAVLNMLRDRIDGILAGEAVVLHVD